MDGESRDKAPSARWLMANGLLFAVPALHPLLIPAIGVPSHLLWWVHVLPVALLTFRCGQRMAAVSVALSAVLVTNGEWLFGHGYGIPAAPQTIAALAVALTATNLLVVSFALYARGVSRRYRLLFDRVRMGVIRVGSDETVTGLNPAARELLGVDETESVLGRPVSELMCIPGLASLRDLESRGVWTGQLEIRTPGSQGPLHAVLTAAADLEEKSYQVFIADRSTEAMQEQEIERQAKLSSLGEALAGVAHELNNPLTAIMAHAQIAEEDVAEGRDVGDVFTIIVDESRRMRDMVAELLGFSRSEDRAQQANVDDVLARIVRVQRITLGKQIPIVAELQSGVTIPVSAHKIEQIVLNLVSNAAYAVAQGGSKITVTSRAERDGVRIEVVDDGPGIEPGIMDRLFEPFATTKPEGEGTGLGLAISRRLARAWGGDLQARNVETGGASFELRLPHTVATSPESARRDPALTGLAV